MRYNFTDQSIVDCGGTLKEASELNISDTVLSYDFVTENWVITTISDINYSILDISTLPTNCIKINSLPTTLHMESIIVVKDDNNNILYGYFTEEQPQNNSSNSPILDPTKLVKVIPGIHKFFNGGSWVSITDISDILGEWRYTQISLTGYHHLMVDGVLVSTL